METGAVLHEISVGTVIKVVAGSEQRDKVLRIARVRGAAVDSEICREDGSVLLVLRKEG